MRVSSLFQLSCYVLINSSTCYIHIKYYVKKGDRSLCSSFEFIKTKFKLYALHVYASIYQGFEQLETRRYAAEYKTK